MKNVLRVIVLQRDNKFACEDKYKSKSVDSFAVLNKTVNRFESVQHSFLCLEQFLRAEYRYFTDF
jgi:hypothetical protein